MDTFVQYFVLPRILLNTIDNNLICLQVLVDF
uniref:Uncharacterized protein n=1 Tax=Siphoviridae sp. ctngK14 TaxID=2827940 RepID=A0A8S5TBJ1_9CAUD|nr:MAG TPA: hypothetical protein [Siphoviridae sp. ctngK14]